MGTYRRGKIWWISYTGPGGESVRESTGSTDSRVADRLLRDRKLELLAGTWRPREVGSDKRPTISSYTARWISSLRARGVKTARSYEQRMVDHVIPVFGARAMVVYFVTDGTTTRCATGASSSASTISTGPRTNDRCQSPDRPSDERKGER